MISDNLFIFQLHNQSFVHDMLISPLPKEPALLVEGGTKGDFKVTPRQVTMERKPSCGGKVSEATRRYEPSVFSPNLGSTKIIIQIGLFSYCLSKTNLVSSSSNVNRFPLRLIVNVSAPSSIPGTVELVVVTVIVESLMV